MENILLCAAVFDYSYADLTCVGVYLIYRVLGMKTKIIFFN